MDQELNDHLTKDVSVAESLALKSSTTLTNLGDRALLWGLVVLGTAWAVDQKEGALHLLDVIESDKSDVGIWEGLGASLDLAHNLGTISASEHWQLPHRPVTVIEVVACNSSRHTSSVDGHDVGSLWGRELQAWGVSIADNVVNLLDDLLLREWWEIRESLEELVVDWVPHLHHDNHRALAPCSAEWRSASRR